MSDEIKPGDWAVLARPGAGARGQWAEVWDRRRAEPSLVVEVSDATATLYEHRPDVHADLWHAAPDDLRVVHRAVYEPSIDAAHLARQATWSRQTFGPGPRTAGVVDHIRKELTEIEADPLDLAEWVDVIILGFDGAWRAGHSPDEIINAVKAKQAKNEARTWPDWRTADRDHAIKHDRTGEAPADERSTR